MTETALSKFSEYEGIAHGMCRRAGCKCQTPLLGWTEHNTPRCRLCNVEVLAAAPALSLTGLRELEKLRAFIAGKITFYDGQIEAWSRTKDDKFGAARADHQAAARELRDVSRKIDALEAALRAATEE